MAFLAMYQVIFHVIFSGKQLVLNECWLLLIPEMQVGSSSKVLLDKVTEQQNGVT